MATIYKLTNKKNGRTYIGCTTRSVNARLYEHKNILKNGHHFNDEMQADYDNDNMDLSVEVLLTFEATKEAAQIIEMKYIQREVNPYNIKTGLKGAMDGRWGKIPKAHAEHRNQQIRILRPFNSALALSRHFGCSSSLISQVAPGHGNFRYKKRFTSSFTEMGPLDEKVDKNTVVKEIEPPASTVKYFYEAVQEGK